MELVEIHVNSRKEKRALRQLELACHCLGIELADIKSFADAVRENKILKEQNSKLIHTLKVKNGEENPTESEQLDADVTKYLSEKEEIR